MDYEERHYSDTRNLEFVLECQVRAHRLLLRTLRIIEEVDQKEFYSADTVRIRKVAELVWRLDSGFISMILD